MQEMQAISIVGTVSTSAHKESLVDTSGVLVAVRVQYRFEPRAQRARRASQLAAEPALSALLRLVEPSAASRSLGPDRRRCEGWRGWRGSGRRRLERGRARWGGSSGWRCATRSGSRRRDGLSDAARRLGGGVAVGASRGRACRSPGSSCARRTRRRRHGGHTGGRVRGPRRGLSAAGASGSASARCSSSSNGAGRLGGAMRAADQVAGTDLTWSPAARRR